MVSQRILGQVITFYSYKGGTGRSMALANVACVLAKRYSRKNGVLVIDWDLDAPGLHRYFRDYFRDVPDSQSVDTLPGLIEFFYEICESLPDSQGVDENKLDDLFEKVKIEDFITSTNISNLHLLKAGCFDENYSKRVSSFHWGELFDRAPTFFQTLALRLARKFEFVLIDSRTGFTDISGICTSLMPDKLVIVFTPNRQNLLGAMAQVRQATEYRVNSDDLRPLAVFPLASRIEISERELHRRWRFGTSTDPHSTHYDGFTQLPLFDDDDFRLDDIYGYQPMFEALLGDVYKLPGCDLGEYFDAVQIQHVPSYAYGEEIAVLLESGDDRFSLARSYIEFTDRLVQLQGPWESKEEIIEKFVNQMIQRPAEMLPKIERLVAEVPDDAHARFLRSDIHTRLGDYQKAISDLDDAIRLKPDYEEALLARAELYLKRNDPEKAFVDVNRCIEIGPSNVRARLLRSQILMQSKRYEEALSDLNAITALDPDAELSGLKVTILADAKRYKEAIELLDNVLAHAPNNVDYLEQKARISILQRRFGEALGLLGRALALRPDNPSLLIGRSETLRRLSRYEEALTDLERAIDLEPALREQHSNERGLLLSYLGKYDEALECYRSALASLENLRPPAYVLYNIAVATAKLKGSRAAKPEISKAREALQSLLESGERGAGLYGLAGLAAIEGDDEKALTLLRQAMDDRTMHEEIVSWAEHDTPWTELRNTERFLSIVK